MVLLRINELKCAGSNGMFQVCVSSDWELVCYRPRAISVRHRGHGGPFCSPSDICRNLPDLLKHHCLCCGATRSKGLLTYDPGTLLPLRHTESSLYGKTFRCKQGLCYGEFGLVCVLHVSEQSL